jgi:hypothetical protein
MEKTRPTHRPPPFTNAFFKAALLPLCGMGKAGKTTPSLFPDPDRMHCIPKEERFF